MAPLHRHCALARSRLSSPASPNVSSLRARSIHLTTRLGADNNDSNSSHPNKSSESSSRPQLRSVTRNKVAVNAISNNQTSSVKDTVIRFVDGSKPRNASTNNVTDARSLGSNISNGARGPILARRPTTKPHGGDSTKPSPAVGPRGGQGGKGFSGESNRSRGGGGRGGAGRKSRRKGGKNLYEDPDDMDLEDVEALEMVENQKSEMADGNDEDLNEPKIPPALSEIVADLSNPSEVLETVDRMKLKPVERAYVMDKLAERTRPVPYIPSFDPTDLIGYGPRAPFSKSMLGATDSLHQALSRAAHLDRGMPADGHSPVVAAQELLKNRTVFLRDEAAKKEFDEAAKEQAQYRRESRARSESKDIADVPLEDTELLSLKPEDRAVINEYFVAGKYTTPGNLAPKNTSDAVRNIYQQIARNASYFEEDQISLATKITAMLPATKPATAVKADPAKKQTANV